MPRKPVIASGIRTEGRTAEVSADDFHAGVRRPQLERDHSAEQIQRDACLRRRLQPESRDQPERGADDTEHRAERIGGVQPADGLTADPKPSGYALHRRKRRAHRRSSRQQQEKRSEERHRPLPERGRLRAVSSSIGVLMGAIAKTSTRLHVAMTISHEAYHHAAGLGVVARRSKKRAAKNEPTLNPPKNAVTTASTPAAS